MSQNEQISNEKPRLPGNFAETRTESALKEHIESYIDEQIDYIVKPLKMQCKSILNALEMHQGSIDLSFKELNMRVNAITGHVTKSEKAKRKDYIDFQDPMAAVRWVNEVRKANGMKAIDTQIFERITTDGSGKPSNP